VRYVGGKLAAELQGNCSGIRLYCQTCCFVKGLEGICAVSYDGSSGISAVSGRLIYRSRIGEESGAKPPTGHSNRTWPGGCCAPVMAPPEGRPRLRLDRCSLFSRFVPESAVADGQGLSSDYLPAPNPVPDARGSAQARAVRAGQRWISIAGCVRRLATEFTRPNLDVYLPEPLPRAFEISCPSSLPPIRGAGSVGDRRVAAKRCGCHRAAGVGGWARSAAPGNCRCRLSPAGRRGLQ
jgi:hypothetical protein